MGLLQLGHSNGRWGMAGFQFDDSGCLNAFRQSKHTKWALLVAVGFGFDFKETSMSTASGDRGNLPKEKGWSLQAAYHASTACTTQGAMCSAALPKLPRVVVLALLGYTGGRPGDQTVNATPKRRPFQYSLLTLMVVVTLASVAMSWVAVQMNRPRYRGVMRGGTSQHHGQAIFATSRKWSVTVAVLDMLCSSNSRVAEAGATCIGSAGSFLGLEARMFSRPRKWNTMVRNQSSSSRTNTTRS